MKWITYVAFLSLLAIPSFLFGQMADCPMHAQHMAQQSKDGVESRHDSLGVSHEKTHHAFRLFDDGAAIELRANDETDTATIAAVRKHIRTIADQFQANDFSTPMFVHDKTPAGVTTIKELHAQIDFRYEALPAGARIRMTTSNAAALDALHEFMRFQIDEHHSGGSATVEHETK